MLKNIKIYKNNKKAVAGFLFIIILSAFLFLPNFSLTNFQCNQWSVLAQGPELGTNYVDELGLSKKDPRVAILEIIRIALTFIGIIAVIMVMYAGFLWMTSEGNEDKIGKAKKTLINAVIGLIIILASFMIVTFVINKINEALGVAGPGTGKGPGRIGHGLGALGACTIESVYPEPNQKKVPRNTAIIVTFKEKIATSTICNDGGDGTCDNDPVVFENIRIFKTNSGDKCKDPPFDCGGNVVDVSVSSIDNKTFVFVPTNYLSPAFSDEYIWFSVYLSNDITKLSDGKGVFDTCKTDFFEWKFQVINKLDLDPPRVKRGDVFPAPDNERDTSTETDADQAEGTITVSAANQLNYFIPSSIIKATTSGGAWSNINVASSTINENCDADGDYEIETDSSDLSHAELKQGAILLGTGPINGNTVTFSYCNLTLELVSGDFTSNCDGSMGECMWNVQISPARNADTLTVGNVVYTFVTQAQKDANSSNWRNIVVYGGAGYLSTSTIAGNIESGITSHPNVESYFYSSGDDEVEIRAIVAGSAGNNIALLKNSSGLTLSPTSEHLENGVDGGETITVNGRKDKARNAIIQVNFNEAINPITVSGDADDVQDYIKIVNADSAALTTGTACINDADCISFNCDIGGTDLCVGVNDYLEGTFEVSNQYRTVEFISDNLCGVNGCGEKIYCLPGKSNLRVELVAAELTDCGADNCASRNPYNNCAGGHCQNSDNENYPLSNAALMNGVMDVCLNSLDGDRSEDAEGPINFYNENDALADCLGLNDDGSTRIKICTLDNKDSACISPDECRYTDNSSVVALTERITSLQGIQGDSYQLSFFISNILYLTPPAIDDLAGVTDGTVPAHSDTNVNLSDPVLVYFNKLMKSSSLKTGSTKIFNGKNDVTHKSINLWNFSNRATGYWIAKENIDDPDEPDGEADWTVAEIRHSMFGDATSYRTQVGSGVKDIYQNCFKPSSGPACIGAETVDEAEPSCCSGVAKDDAGIDENGNCQ